MKYYECGICDCIHPWDFVGDCRDDQNRLSYDNLSDDAHVYSWEDRQIADLENDIAKVEAINTILVPKGN